MMRMRIYYRKDIKGKDFYGGQFNDRFLMANLEKASNTDLSFTLLNKKNRLLLENTFCKTNME